MTQYGSETILPYNKEEQKGTQVKRMFDSIAETYDQLNHTLSFGIDKIWRRKGIAFMRPFSPKTILDNATGTGDLAISMYKKLRPDHIVGAVISLGMMEVGRKKVAAAGYSEHISFEQQDCTALTYEENSFDAVTAAFGVRNFENIEQGISEMYRVLKPGGIFCGCFYVADEHKRTDWFVRHIYEKAGFFTPPYETVSSLKKRLEHMYTAVTLENVKGIAWFVCRKEAKTETENEEQKETKA